MSGPAPDAPARLAPSPWLETDLAVRAELLTQAERRRLPAHEPAREPDGAPRVTAVILSHDRPQLVLGAIHSLLHDTSVPVEILILDNDSTAVTRKILTEACDGHPSIRIHFSDSNLGCAGGRQLGLEQASGELVLFLDDDAELLPGALELLVRELDLNPATAGVSATVVLPDGRVSHSGGRLERTDELVSFTLIDSGLWFADPKTRASGSCDWIAGTAALIRREALERHPLDTGMAAYYEDTEWCFRVAAATPEDQRANLFRHSREALAVHHAKHKPWGRPDRASRAQWVRFIATAAHFYRKHGLLLVSPGVDLFTLMPELMRTDGTRDLRGARLVMELAATHSQDWLLREWMDGGLEPLLGVERTRLGDELHASRLEADELRSRLARVYGSRLWRLGGLLDRVRQRLRL